MPTSALLVAGVADDVVSEIRVIHKDGTALWFDVEASGGNDPLVGGYMLSLRNVSAQRATQESAQRRAEFESVVLDLSQWALEVESDDIVPGLDPHLERMAQVLACGLGVHRVARRRPGAQRRRLEGDGCTAPELATSRPDRGRCRRSSSRYRSLEPLIVTDIDDHDEAWADEWRSFPVPDRSGLNVPLVSAGQVSRQHRRGDGRARRECGRTTRSRSSRRCRETVAVLLARHRVEDVAAHE